MLHVYDSPALLASAAGQDRVSLDESFASSSSESDVSHEGSWQSGGVQTPPPMVAEVPSCTPEKTAATALSNSRPSTSPKTGEGNRPRWQRIGNSPLKDMAYLWRKPGHQFPGGEAAEMDFRDSKANSSLTLHGEFLAGGSVELPSVDDSQASLDLVAQRRPATPAHNPFGKSGSGLPAGRWVLGEDSRPRCIPSESNRLEVWAPAKPKPLFGGLGSLLRLSPGLRQPAGEAVEECPVEAIVDDVLMRRKSSERTGAAGGSSSPHAAESSSDDGDSSFESSDSSDEDSDEEALQKASKFEKRASVELMKDKLAASKRGSCCRRFSRDEQFAAAFAATGAGNTIRGSVQSSKPQSASHVGGRMSRTASQGTDRRTSAKAFGQQASNRNRKQQEQEQDYTTKKWRPGKRGRGVRFSAQVDDIAVEDVEDILKTLDQESRKSIPDIRASALAMQEGVPNATSAARRKTAQMVAHSQEADRFHGLHGPGLLAAKQRARVFEGRLATLAMAKTSTASSLEPGETDGESKTEAQWQEEECDDFSDVESEMLSEKGEKDIRSSLRTSCRSGKVLLVVPGGSASRPTTPSGAKQSMRSLVKLSMSMRASAAFKSLAFGKSVVIQDEDELEELVEKEKKVDLLQKERKQREAAAQRQAQHGLRNDLKKMKESLMASAQGAFDGEVWDACGVEAEHLKRQQLAATVFAGLGGLLGTTKKSEDEQSAAIALLEERARSSPLNFGAVPKSPSPAEAEAAEGQQADGGAEDTNPERPSTPPTFSRKSHFQALAAKGQQASDAMSEALKVLRGVRADGVPTLLKKSFFRARSSVAAQNLEMLSEKRPSTLGGDRRTSMLGQEKRPSVLLGTRRPSGAAAPERRVSGRRTSAVTPRRTSVAQSNSESSSVAGQKRRTSELDIKDGRRQSSCRQSSTEGRRSSRRISNVGAKRGSVVAEPRAPQQVAAARRATIFGASFDHVARRRMDSRQAEALHEGDDGADLVFIAKGGDDAKVAQRRSTIVASLAGGAKVPPPGVVSLGQPSGPLRRPSGQS
eukprot:TRINITY_DN1510_c0_g3_i1.p1 TRINITY_DN1510_c0_g3~~TRINITY_DN1510_c0_g3_i1.p1  ORF type:complete len:1039 (+),score=220.64 TRINITY_DN1510_c0_g3_i1:72-3188(+)